MEILIVLIVVLLVYAINLRYKLNDESIANEHLEARCEELEDRAIDLEKALEKKKLEYGVLARKALTHLNLLEDAKEEIAVLKSKLAEYGKSI